jgi:hypothetical protein
LEQVDLSGAKQLTFPTDQLGAAGKGSVMNAILYPTS